MSTSNSTQLPVGVKDIAGKSFGKLTAVSYAGTNLGSQAGAYWHFHCECGTEKVISAGAVRSGSIQSCGCSKQRTDEVGSVYGKLTVIEFSGKTKSGDSRWKCICQCGNETTVARGELRKGSTISCGCHRARARGACRRRQNESAGGACRGRQKTPEYTSWQEMQRRCYNPNAPYYEIYGGRGITVCQRWLDAFVNFLDDMGEKPFPSATLHRIDGEAGYEKSNCKWASKLEQSQNTSKVRMLSYNGETYCLREWARRLGITHRTLSVRLTKGWSPEKVFSSEHYFTPPPIKKACPKP